MISILHITPHLGGGVGRVLMNHMAHAKAQPGERHAIASLETANPWSVARAAAAGVPLTDRMAQRIPALIGMIEECDLVVIHWWNHPLLCALLVNQPLPPARLILWSHVAGLFPTQNFTDPLIAYPDRFVMATPHSLKAPAIARLGEAERSARVRLVFTCAGTEHVRDASPRPHDGFRVGYVGTVDYCKMHHDFVRMSAAANLPGGRFIVCGGPNEEAVRRDALRAGVAERFEFLGHVEDVSAMLGSFDVFGYPLAPDHYGTGEQALIEALAAGVPPVVLANGAEEHIVEDGVTGIVARDAEGYSRALELLQRDPQLRRTLSENARAAARERFTIYNLVRQWSSLYAEVARLPRRPRSWGQEEPGRVRGGAELYLASLGEHGADCRASRYGSPGPERVQAEKRIAGMGGLFRARTRGTVFHYHAFFPEDPFLNLWCGLMLAAEGRHDEAKPHLSEALRQLGAERVAPYLNRKIWAPPARRLRKAGMAPKEQAALPLAEGRLP